MKVVCVYRAPGNSISDVNKKWEDTLQKMSFSNKDIYICGDLKINLLNTDSLRKSRRANLTNFFILIYRLTNSINRLSYLDLSRY